MSVETASDVAVLADQLTARRVAIDEFLRTQRPRSRRLTTTAIASSGAAAAFTAGPAFGGPGFATSAAELFGLATTSVVWQVLCLAAMVVSVVSAVVVSVARSTDLASRVVAAETAGAELDGLTLLLRFGQIGLGDAVKQYQASVAKVPFVRSS